MKHYKGFIEVASCLASLRREVAAMSSHLAVLQDDFPALSEACESFTAEAKQHLARRTQNKQLQSKLLQALGYLRSLLEGLESSCSSASIDRFGLPQDHRKDDSTI